jgi:hypothetical protein
LLFRLSNILCRVGDIFHHFKRPPWCRKFPVLSTFSHQLVKLMRNDSLCFVNQKTSSVISYHLQKTLCKSAYWDEISRQQFGNAPVSRYSVYHKQKKHGWVIEKRYVVRLLDGPAACTWGILMLLISCTCGCKTNCATKRCSCMSQGLLWTYGYKCSDLCQNTNRR